MLVTEYTNGVVPITQASEDYIEISAEADDARTATTVSHYQHQHQHQHGQHQHQQPAVAPGPARLSSDGSGFYSNFANQATTTATTAASTRTNHEDNQRDSVGSGFYSAFVAPNVLSTGPRGSTASADMLVVNSTTGTGTRQLLPREIDYNHPQPMSHQTLARTVRYKQAPTQGGSAYVELDTYGESTTSPSPPAPTTPARRTTDWGNADADTGAMHMHAQQPARCDTDWHSMAPTGSSSIHPVDPSDRPLVVAPRVPRRSTSTTSVQPLIEPCRDSSGYVHNTACY